MGDVIPFRRSVKQLTNTVLWGEGQFGFNPYFVKHMFVANDVNICFMFHDPEDGEFDGWELMVKCYSPEECKLAYNDLLRIFEEQYGITFSEEQ